MNLSGEQRKKLLEALNDAFRDKASLERMLAFELDKNLDAIAGGNSLQDIVFNLIKIAEAQGWLEDLVCAARRSNSGNPLLIIIAEELFPIKSPEPYKVPSPNILPQQSTQKQKILILAAIPQGLRLDKEIREIEEAIRRATNRDLFEIKVRTAIRPQDIRRAIAEERPQIVHFCGHGEQDGSLRLEDDGGNNKPVSPESLASLFKLHADYVKCVLLNACYSALPAEAISKHINYVIGMNQPIEDKSAIVFAQGFYDGLGYDNINNLDVIQRAFDEGIVAIQLENLLQGAIPSIWKLGIAQDNLLTDHNVDYTELRNFLKAGKWKEADRETYLVMLKVVGREDGDFIRDKELFNFPCTDLRTIDQLWVKYSNKRFGFSVQKKIYLEVGGVPDGNFSEEAWENFGVRVGWKVKGSWIYYLNCTFDTKAPVGHLPVRGHLPVVPRWRGGREGGQEYSSLASRLVNCNI